MHTHSQILVVSRDRMLLQTRRLILGTYFEVEGAGRVSEAGSILSEHEFDIIVLCDTLSPAECTQIANMVREQTPHPTLLSLLGPGNKNANIPIGRKLPCGSGPLQLLKECAELLGCDLRGKQRMFSN